jgi:catechol 2,3-dioxygenase-like lactoylglutathione lyase family enzyme
MRAMAKRETKAIIRNQTLIAVRDVEASSRFYQRLLGFESGHGGVNYERLYHDGTLMMQLHAWDHENHPNLVDRESSRPGHGVLIWFETDAFDAAVEHARALSATIIEEPHVNPSSQQREIWLRDPDDYVVVIAEAP